MVESKARHGHVIALDVPSVCPSGCPAAVFLCDLPGLYLEQVNRTLDAHNLRAATAHSNANSQLVVVLPSPRASIIILACSSPYAATLNYLDACYTMC
jgi:hypothetical protein